MTKFILSLLASVAIAGLSGSSVFASTPANAPEQARAKVQRTKPLTLKAPAQFTEAANETIYYSCSFDFLKEGSETEPAAIELDDLDNIPAELIGEENYGFGGQGIMQAGGALYIPFQYNADPGSTVPWMEEGLMWTPDLYEPMMVTIELDAKIAEGCTVKTDELWAYANDYVTNIDYDSGKISTEWTHLTLKIDVTKFAPESEDDSYYFTLFVDGGADIVLKNIVIKSKNSVTGIESVAIDDNETDAIYYNLQGQKLVNIPKGTPVVKVSGSIATKVIY